ncbi:MAG: type II secretion system protein GspM [Gammaproteobacteria bacterium]
MNLTPYQKRLAALVFLVVLVSVVAVVVIYPLAASYAANRATLADMQFQLERYERLAAGKSVVGARLTQLQRHDVTKALYLTGDTPELASASMQQYLKKIVDTGAGQVISTQVLPEQADELPLRAGLRVNMKANIDSLLQIFYRLEAGRPMLFLDNVMISAPPGNRSETRIRPGAGLLDVRFDLFGFIKEGA